MGARIATKRELIEELDRVKRHIDQAVLELAEARACMAGDAADVEGDKLAGPKEREMATLCISLDLALADSVTWAHRLADKVRHTWKSPEIRPCRTK